MAQEIIRRHKEAKWEGEQREERDYRITKWAHEKTVVEEKRARSVGRRQKDGRGFRRR